MIIRLRIPHILHHQSRYYDEYYGSRHCHGWYTAGSDVASSSFGLGMSVTDIIFSFLSCFDIGFVTFFSLAPLMLKNNNIYV